MLPSQRILGPIPLNDGPQFVANDGPNNVSRLSNMPAYLLGLLNALRSPVESDWALFRPAIYAHDWMYLLTLAANGLINEYLAKAAFEATLARATSGVWSNWQGLFFRRVHALIGVAMALKPVRIHLVIYAFPNITHNNQIYPSDVPRRRSAAHSITRFFLRSDMPRPSCTARLLKTLAAAIGHESAHMELKWMQQAVASADSARSPAVPDLSTMVARRTTGEPLQYILGTQPFGPLHLRCRPPVLIPRPETEDWALRLSEAVAPSPSQPVRALDLCTGSGCIPLLLCARWASGSVRAVAVDHSQAALQLASDNAEACGVPVRLLEGSNEDEDKDANVDEARGGNGNDGENTNTLTLLHADVLDPGRLLAKLPFRRFDIVTANPPYITRAAYAALPPSVRDFEDRTALLGD
ncbi:hypothetical protein EVG20_g8272, partial [Dentipellis fragilis]